MNLVPTILLYGLRERKSLLWRACIIFRWKRVPGRLFCYIYYLFSGISNRFCSQAVSHMCHESSVFCKSSYVVHGSSIYIWQIWSLQDASCWPVVFPKKVILTRWFTKLKSQTDPNAWIRATRKVSVDFCTPIPASQHVLTSRRHGGFLWKNISEFRDLHLSFPNWFQMPSISSHAFVSTRLLNPNTRIGSHISLALASCYPHFETAWVRLTFWPNWINIRVVWSVVNLWP